MQYLHRSDIGIFSTGDDRPQQFIAGLGGAARGQWRHGRSMWRSNASVADPKLKARFGDLGATVFTGSPPDFGKLIADETEKWGKVIRAANIKPV
jgi:hypothetical protein